MSVTHFYILYNIYASSESEFFMILLQSFLVPKLSLNVSIFWTKHIYHTLAGHQNSGNMEPKEADPAYVSDLILFNLKPKTSSTLGY